MKALLHPSAPSTPFPRRNLLLCVSSLMRTLLQGSSVPLAPPMGLQFFSSRRKMALFNFLRTQSNLPERLVPTSAHFRPLRRTKKSTNLYQDQPSAHLPSRSGCTRRRMEDSLPDPL